VAGVRCAAARKQHSFPGVGARAGDDHEGGCAAERGGEHTNQSNSKSNTTYHPPPSIHPQDLTELAEKAAQLEEETSALERALERERLAKKESSTRVMQLESELQQYVPPSPSDNALTQ
jgi:hypothetical protein